MRYLILVAIVLAAATGQLMLKFAVVKHDSIGGSIDLYWRLLRDIHFWIGFTLYGATSIAWLWVLKHFPLSHAYPILALSFALVPLLSITLFQEKLVYAQYLGIALILLGVALVGMNTL